MEIAECVPNVSEGKNRNKISRMADTISACPGVSLLHVDSNPDANRTVFTFAGKLSDVTDAAFALFRIAIAEIDMTHQHGEHVRNGALDVCPIIPVSDISISECIAAARALGKRIGDTGVPVYLYGDAAVAINRRELAQLRKGQYETLQRRIRQPEWQPDFGPMKWSETIARAGSVQVGVRPFLVAWNVNLKTKNIHIAKKIARKIRTSGFRGINGEFNFLKADGWRMPSYDCAQVTMNLTDYRHTGLHNVYERIRELANASGTDVNGSELVGLIPLDAILAAGRWYAGDRDGSLDNDALIDLAVHNLGLDSLTPFITESRIFEYRLAGAAHLRGD